MNLLWFAGGIVVCLSLTLILCHPSIDVYYVTHVHVLQNILPINISY
jgi:hypothetical protein